MSASDACASSEPSSAVLNSSAPPSFSSNDKSSINRMYFCLNPLRLSRSRGRLLSSVLASSITFKRSRYSLAIARTVVDLPVPRSPYKSVWNAGKPLIKFSVLRTISDFSSA